MHDADPEFPDATPDVPDVDELEGRLRDVEDTMTQLQDGELDDAERSIEMLERRVAARPDQPVDAEPQNSGGTDEHGG